MVNQHSVVVSLIVSLTQPGIIWEENLRNDLDQVGLWGMEDCLDDNLYRNSQPMWTT